VKEGVGVNDILGQTCKVLGEITKQLGVSIAPRFEEGILKRLELIPLTDERVMVVVVVRSGLARSVIVEVETSISESSLREVESVLNERLAGLTLGEIRKTISKRLADVSKEGRLLKMVIDSKDKIWRDDHSSDVRIWGAENLVKQPEFADPERISGLMKILGDSKVLSEFLEEVRDEGLIITIGRENRFNEILQCSLVTSTYRVGNISGTIGIVGPTRMPYSKLVSVVEYTAKTITEMLSGLDKKKGS
jgi:heat-inducible transcriptional repressor